VIAIPDSTITPAPADGLFAVSAAQATLATSRGALAQFWLDNSSVAVKLRHFSLLVYAIPARRARPLLPRSFELAEYPGRRRFTLLSVISSLDQGPETESAVPGGRSYQPRAFEQTSYCLQVRRQGELGYWLLGSSLGSLQAVAPRRLWPQPWHLGAMKFHAAYDQRAGRYRAYRLQTQSRWANADWELGDTGEPWDAQPDSRILHSLLPPLAPITYFLRRDGALGATQTQYDRINFTRGYLKRAACDLLERLGLLTAEELHRPSLVALQHRLACRTDAASITDLNTPMPRRLYEPARHHLPALSQH
jgi:hypothetical protein